MQVEVTIGVGFSLTPSHLHLSWRFMVMNSYYSSFSGNQLKWVQGNNFLKTDYFGGEAVVEYLVSLFLESSKNALPFVVYRYHV